MNRLSNDWIAGDLLKVTREHYFAKGNAEGVWPKIFQEQPGEDGQLTIIESHNAIPAGTVVMALDDKPSCGREAVIRVLHDDGVWVANSNYVMRKSCTTANQEKCSL